MAGLIGSHATVVSSGAERKKHYNITTTTTSLTGLQYTPTKVHVYHNGIRLVDGTDYTATNGTSITLTNAAENGDDVVVISYATFQPSDTVSKTTGGTFEDAITIDADGTTVLTVDRATSDGTVIDVQKNGASVGSIGTVAGRMSVGNADAGVIFAGDIDAIYPANGISARDAAVDLGASGARFKDLYLSGGVYLGGTGSANKLDDYEEGTWTPTVTTGTLSLSGGMGANYVKVGRMVHFQFYISWSNTANNDSSTFYIAGLPFTPADNYSSFNIGYVGTANTNDFAPTINFGNATLYFHYNAGSGGGTVPNSVIHSRGVVTLIGSGSYVTNA